MPESTSHNEQQEMQNIIGVMPSSIWRRGLLFVLLLVVIFVAAAYFVRYPDIVEVPVYLTTEKPVVEVINPAPATLDTILVKEGQEVEKDEVLAWYSSDVNPESIFMLENFLRNLDDQPNAETMVALSFPDLTDMGSLQGAVGDLEMALVQLKDQYQSTNIVQQIGSLKQQQHLTEQLSASLQQQVIKLEEEVSLAEKNYRDFEGLFKTGAASEIEKDAAKTTWLAIQRLQESKKAEVLQNEVRFEQDHCQHQHPGAHSTTAVEGLCQSGASAEVRLGRACGSLEVKPHAQGSGRGECGFFPPGDLSANFWKLKHLYLDLRTSKTHRECWQ
jgi:hypothetical protein